MKRAGLQSSKFSVGAILALAAGLILIPQPARAATAGTGACQQTYTVTGTGEVAVYENAGYCYVAFKNTGAVNSQAVFSWTRPTQVLNVDVLVVGGGGGGGARHGGGGGAGGFVQTDGYSISSLSSMTVAVGAGGAASTGGTGTSGQNSYFKELSGSTRGLVAIGGGAGSSGGSSGGGSSGGSGYNQSVGTVTAQTQSTLAGSTLNGVSFGNVGASGANDTNSGTDNNDYWAGGGGGGAGGAGSWPLSNGSPVTSFPENTSSTARGGNGGGGKSVSWITSTVASNLSVGHTSSGTVYFAGGGGGGIGVDGISGGTGGLGGGANGTRTESVGSAGAAFTGGGGGGSGFDDINKVGSPETVSAAPAGAGGSGIVVLRFTAPDIAGPVLSFTTFATSPSNGYYTLGETATVQFTYNETVTVTGSPRIPITGMSGKYFTYASGSGSKVLLFSYVVAVGDLNSPGVGVASNTLELNGGTMKDLALNDASLTNQALNPNGFHKFDGVVPTVSSVATATDGKTIVITLSETQSAVSLSGTPFNVTINSTRSVVTSAVQSGPRVTLTLTFGVIAGDTVSLTYTDPTSSNDTYAMQDLAGNDIPTFTISVTNASTATSNTTITLALNPTSTTAIYRLNNSIVATVSAAGKVDFRLQGKIIAGCRNIATVGSNPITATCNWKPSIHNAVRVTALLRPSTTGFTNSTSNSLDVFVVKRTTTR